VTAQPINLHSWPGRGGIALGNYERRSMRAERLREHAGAVCVGVSERYVIPERWALGIVVTFVGSSITGVDLVVADDLESRAPAVATEMENWAASQSIDTPAGPMPVKDITRSDLCHPDTGVITTTCYTGGGWLLTADEGRSLGLLAEHWQAAQGKRFGGGFVLGFPGWGQMADRERVDHLGAGRHTHEWRSKLHRPTLRVKAIGGHGLLAEFNKAGHSGRAPDGSRAGHWERDRNGRMLPFRGRTVDLIGPAFAFDGIDSGDLSQHLTAFDLPALDVPAALPVNADSADRLLTIALAIHRLAVVLDAEAARWLTTRDEQRLGRAAVGLRFMVSPGSLAGAAWRRSGVTPPLYKFAVSDDTALDRWAAAGHGGWVT
jgi:hypothetical protein